MKKFVGISSVTAIAIVIAAAGWHQTTPKSHRAAAERSAHVQAFLERAEEGDRQRNDSPAEALEYFVAKRLPPGETALQTQWYVDAISQSQANFTYSTASAQVGSPGLITSNAALGTWQELGPGNIGGRTRGLVINPNTPSIMYAAGVAGGVWKSTNSGGTWMQLTDLGLPNLAVSSLVIDPNNPNVLYAGTGEGYFNIDAVRGAGIFKTTDGGNTWTQLASTATSDFYYVNKIVISPNNSNRMYATTRTGIWRSLDSGNTWVRGVNGTSVNGCMDLAIQKNRAILYVFASCGTFTTAAATGIYRAIDNNNAQNWTNVFSVPNMGRTSLAIAPSNPSIIYAMSASNATGNYQNGLLGVFRSTSSGASGTWTVQDDNTSGVPPPQTSPTYQNTLLLTNSVYAYTKCVGSQNFFNQGWYDNQLAVDPVNPNVVYSAGIDLNRSDDGGVNWGLMNYWYYPRTDPHFAHADNHVFVFDPNYNGTTNQILRVGNDGGLFITANASAATASGFDGSGLPAACSGTDIPSISWNNLNNNYGVTQFYHGLPYPDGNTLFGGTQDNGTSRGTVGSPNAWTILAGGDGGFVAQDPTNTNVLFHEFTGLSIQKSTDNGATFANAFTGISSDTFPFITVYRMDPGNPQNMWLGGQKMWRTTNQANNWTAATVALTAGSISAMAISSANSNYVLAGTASGRIARTSTGLTDSGASWPFLAPQTVNAYAISWLEWQPGSTSIAYVTYSTFGAPFKVMKTTDGGATWSGLNGTAPNTIPDIPVHCIIVDPTNNSRLYIGTDIGVFTSVDGGVNWMKEVTGFANVIVDSLAFNSIGTVKLYAFTHGRGAWNVGLNTVSAELLRRPRKVGSAASE